MVIQKSSTKTALELDNFESHVDKRLNSIFQKLIKNQNRKINLKKDEFKKFIKYLMNNS